jgi:hypothetical protein
LRTAYPDHLWKEEPKSKPSGYWSDVKHQRQFFDQLALSLGLQKPDDWNRVTSHQVFDKGGSFVKAYYNGSLIQGMRLMNM